ncbi:adenosylcobinamide amidohydrolase [Paenibacillus dakarensis]|uniref:adenosylcobinamide amidohydrolase n=1 Tax=Paenibacillus dakarensis TaxID=1527293 RepID=UPI0006D542DA|nr:adenosylcobinamide amidohydrolase [Paenibacillus dakarensis]
MTTPFLQSDITEYKSSVVPGLTLTRHERYLLLQFPGPFDSLSSAIHGGGVGKLDRAANIYVDRFYNVSDPEKDIEGLFREWDYSLQSTAGLLTAVRLEYASVLEETGKDASVFCCTTAGVSNGARAGSERTTFPAYQPGTINIMLIIDARMTQAAMVNAVITAVEAKTAALADLGIRDAENGLIATGTTTDSIVLGVSQSVLYSAEHRYCGTATDLGAAIGRTVYGTVIESYKAPGVKPS